jgi:hypothetical protein
MDIIINDEIDIKNIDNIKLKKMVFLFNAINDGWTIKKQNGSYIFQKNTKVKKKYFWILI